MSVMMPMRILARSLLVFAVICGSAGCTLKNATAGQCFANSDCRPCEQCRDGVCTPMASDSGPCKAAPLTYTVMYYGNGATSGSVPTDSETHLQSQTVTVLGNTGSLARTGYSFSGWNTQADGSGTTYQQADTFAMGGADVTLYALWVSTFPPSFSVTYNGNGAESGDVPMDNNSYLQWQTVTVQPALATTCDNRARTSGLSP